VTKLSGSIGISNPFSHILHEVFSILTSAFIPDFNGISMLLKNRQGK